MSYNPLRRETETRPWNPPGALDIVKLGGRWAQVAVESPESTTVTYLDDGTRA